MKQEARIPEQGQQLSDGEKRVAELVRRELRNLIAAGTSPWAEVLTQGSACFGCGERGRCAVVCPDAFEALAKAGADRLAGAPGMPGVPAELAPLIDHTLLKADATADQVQTLCAEALQYSFASVCVNPFWTPVCARLLAGSSVKVCTVVGFPLGATSTTGKAEETRRAVADGAQEIDMVINVGALKSRLDKAVEADIAAVVQAAGKKAIVKVILETALLNDEQKIRACELCVAAGADFVKTSTGFGPGGATAGDIALMRRVVGPQLGVKASGGVSDTDTAMRMVRAGATRIGASGSVRIVTGDTSGKASGY